MYRIIAPRNERGDLKKARLNISVGQTYHEGEKFSSLCEWVSRHFNSCVVNMCDTLQRHNLEASGIAPNKAYEMALANGDGWIERNRDAIQSLPNVTITRWDSWRRHPDWENAVNVVNELYKSDNKLREIVEITANSFLGKRNFSSADSKEKALVYSRRYILEEIAFARLSSFDDIADIYPGTFLPAFDYLRDKGFPAPKSMTSISFKRRKGIELAA